MCVSVYVNFCRLRNVCIGLLSPYCSQYYSLSFCSSPKTSKWKLRRETSHGWLAMHHILYQSHGSAKFSVQSRVMYVKPSVCILPVMSLVAKTDYSSYYTVTALKKKKNRLSQRSIGFCTCISVLVFIKEKYNCDHLNRHFFNEIRHRY